MTENHPTHDAKGLHVLDPNDRLGKKSEYITLVHKKSLLRYLPKSDGGIAVDLGCGFGRLTLLLEQSGWKAIGIDPSVELIDYAKLHFSGPDYRIGCLPDLPLAHEGASLILIHNLLRALKLMDSLAVTKGVGRYLRPGGSLLVVDNIRAGHPDYLEESLIREIFIEEGLSLVSRVPLRAGRWWVIYFIRYGLVPEKWLDWIADWELDRMSKKKGLPRWQYWNVLYVFQKKAIES